MKNHRDSNFTYLHNFIECCLHWKPHYRYYLCFYHHYHHRCNGVDSYFGAKLPQIHFNAKTKPLSNRQRVRFVAMAFHCLIYSMFVDGRKKIYICRAYHLSYRLTNTQSHSMIALCHFLEHARQWIWI